MGLTRLSRNARAYAAAAIGFAIITAFWGPIYASKAYDRYDLGNFFAYAAWVDTPGRLYVDVYSDYLLLANLLFAPFRWVATQWNPYHDELKSFGWAWVSTAWVLYVATGWIIATRGRPRSLWLWLAPAPLYFSLFRYEIYIVLLTFAFLFAMERQRWLASSLWLGIIIALKGYGLFLLPCYGIYLMDRVGWRRAAAIVAVALSPFIIEHAAVWLLAGTSGVLMPYRFQGNRPNSVESFYSAIAYLFGADTPKFSPRIAQCLQLVVGLGAAWRRPKTHQEWLLASAFVVLGFVIFSPVTSPQFFLWIVPMIVLIENDAFLRIGHWLSWFSVIDYPIVQFLFGSKVLNARAVTFLSQQTTVAAVVRRYVFPVIVIALNAVRAWMCVALMRALRRPGTSQGQEVIERAYGKGTPG